MGNKPGAPTPHKLYTPERDKAITKLILVAYSVIVAILVIALAIIIWAKALGRL